MDAIDIVARGDVKEQERDVISLVQSALLSARSRRETGKLTVEIELHEGGITKKWINPRYLVK